MTKPGYGAKVLAVHSQTLPIIWRHPKALSPSARLSTSIEMLVDLMKIRQLFVMRLILSYAD